MKKSLVFGLVSIVFTSFALAWNTSFNFLNDTEGRQVIEGFHPPRNDRRDLKQLKRLRTPANLDAYCAKAEEELHPYDLEAFFGSTISPDQLNLVQALLTKVGQDIDLATWSLKDPSQPGGRVRPHIKYPNQIVPCPGIAKDYNPGMSFPSGHAAISCIEALTLGRIFPRRKEEFLKRADEIGWDRELLGVHYPSDVEAGQQMAQRAFKFLEHDPEFRNELGAVQKAVADLPDYPSHPPPRFFPGACAYPNTF